MLTAVGSAAASDWYKRQAEGGCRQRSEHAPEQDWANAGPAGFQDQSGWRLYSRPLDGQRMLTVGQSRTERAEARREVIAVAGAAALLAALIGHFWLRGRVRRELFLFPIHISEPTRPY